MILFAQVPNGAVDAPLILSIVYGSITVMALGITALVLYHRRVLKRREHELEIVKQLLTNPKMTPEMMGRVLDAWRGNLWQPKPFATPAEWSEKYSASLQELK